MKELSIEELNKIESEIGEREYIIIELDKNDDRLYTRRKYKCKGEKEAVERFEIERQTEMGVEGKAIVEVARKCVESIRQTFVEKVWYYEAGDCVMYILEV